MNSSWKSLWQGIRGTFLSGIVAALLVCLLLPLTYDRRVSRAEARMTGSATEREPGTCEPTTPHVVDAAELSALFRRAAQKALPAVVVIKTSYSPVCPRCGRAHEPNDMESEGNVVDEISPRSLEILGSGFIVDPTGVVLTNKHVVRGNTRLMVQTVDGRQYTVRHVRTDKENDAAVLLIESPTPLPYLSLGDSDPVQIGDWVLTIGCPLELDQTVSAGIISANRSLCSRHRDRFLQTDAVVNPGSSGGPLVDLSGAAIGIATALMSDDGGYQGIGFAIPISLVKKFVVEAIASDPAGSKRSSSG